ncbi:MerR family transcriptional regulator [Sphingomonas spermidinifaciens]|uniref:MerR family transcriptional regulator n=1 Tax=Sphingomonas spermidinifaciens TaxID=1141889 RepID=A0A2A4B1Q3_9SPHN|nr:MerR family transcriptional regulator [Sphingomonas spermidinifaciens]PCD01977.1 MerR family transcriptional regulator [Sphingomonas spermidinifaciens]
MTIGELAKAGGVGVETVRYYQRRGLLGVPERPPGGGSSGGIRRYGVAEAERLRFIRTAQAAGFTLDQIGDLLALDAVGDRAGVRRLAAARVVALDDQIAALTAARTALSKLADACGSGGAGPCPILAAFKDDDQSAKSRTGVSRSLRTA